MRGSDVFLKEDLRGILRSLLVTNETAAAVMAPPDDPIAMAYRSGFHAAIAAMATALDIPPTTAIARR